MAQYLQSIELASEEAEYGFILGQKMTCYGGLYPFGVLPHIGLDRLDFAPITVLCGGNGSGKTTLLNVIAQKAGATRYSAYNGSAFFGDYIGLCRLYSAGEPESIEMLTSDDVFDYLLDQRSLNDGADDRRRELLEEYSQRRFTSHLLTSLEDYDDWKESVDAKRRTASRFVNDRLMKNAAMHSNGESAMKYFIERVKENAVYLLDEPENSLSVERQEELAKFLGDSARYFGCQLIIATHSPIILSMPGARVYDLDARPVTTRRWCEVENVRRLYEFFERHESDFR